MLRKLKGKEFHIQAESEVINCDQFGFRICTGREDDGTEISFNIKKSELNFISTRLDYKPENKKIQLDILIDRSSIELFLDNGRYVMSYPFSPKPESDRYELFTLGGEILVHKMDVHQMKSIWNEE